MDSSTIVTKALEGHAEAMRKIESITTKRFAYDPISTVAKEGGYFLGITGLRGIGKTVLLSQLAKEHGGIYVSADDRNLRGVDLYDIIKALSAAWHKKIFVDEIHSKPPWDQDLKTVHDEGLAYVAFTGSSAIQLKTLKADLSRRVVIEHLKPASFREWLHIRKGIEFPKLTMAKLIKERASIARQHGHAHAHLKEYYETGGVLYEAKSQFYKTIVSTIETIAYKDFSAVKDVQPGTVENFFKLLQLIAASNPMELSYSSIGEALGRDKVWVMRFLAQVEQTEALKRVYACGKEGKPYRKEAKYYLPFPYRASLCANAGIAPSIGSLREEFFINHVDCCFNPASGSALADFMACGLSFEVGGKGKGNKQKADYRVLDGLDTSGNRLPLFAIGLLY
ncbi:MAG: AAA family ATPase [Candidatus Micrarchaeota archaeon]